MPLCASEYQNHLSPKMMCRPIASQRKFQSHTISQRVIRVGSSAAMPLRKNRRKSSPKLTRADPRGGVGFRLTSGATTADPAGASGGWPTHSAQERGLGRALLESSATNDADLPSEFLHARVGKINAGGRRHTS